jgi:hypothetical protein
MSVPAPLSDAIPEETIRVARAAFPKGNVFMRMPDALGPLIAIRSLRPCFLLPGNLPKIPRGSPWCW